MSRKKGTEYDKQIDIWSRACQVLMDYVVQRGRVGDKVAQDLQLKVLAILYENEGEEEGEET